MDYLKINFIIIEIIILFHIWVFIKKKSIPKSRNENKLPEKVTKSQTKLNNFEININNNNNAGTITNMKQNQNNNLKNITSIGNYNFNYKQGLQKSRNQQQSISINSNTYTKNSFNKINNIKPLSEINSRKLKYLFIQNNQIEDIQVFIDFYSNFKSLDILILDDNNLKEDSFKILLKVYNQIIFTNKIIDEMKNHYNIDNNEKLEEIKIEGTGEGEAQGAGEEAAQEENHENGENKEE